MSFNSKHLLSTTGPGAGLIFASWIFLGYLNQRHMNSADRYITLVDQYRQPELQGTHRQALNKQILLCKKRCEQMRHATNIGLVAAILLISTLIVGTLQMAIPWLEFLKYVAVVCSIAGLGMVIWATAIVIVENTSSGSGLGSRRLSVGAQNQPVIGG